MDTCVKLREKEVKLHDDESISRRSVDWRDSGIVIDDDFHLSSLDFSSSDIAFATNSVLSIGCETSSPNLFEEDDDGDTILHLAVVGCSIEKVQDLVKICDLDAINNMMHTPLHVATMANRPDAIKCLLDQGADIDVHDRQGNTPLHLACQKGFIEIADIILDQLRTHEGSQDLVKIRYQLERTNFDGQTCLHLASLNNHRDIIRLLVIKYNNNINCQDSRSGETILHKAINQYNIGLIDFILQFDGHCNQQDFNGRRPLDAVNMLLQSNLDVDNIAALESAQHLIKDRIAACKEAGGCCLDLMDCSSDIENDSSDESETTSGSECGSYTDSSDISQ